MVSFNQTNIMEQRKMIIFKAKPYPVIQSDDSERTAIDWKKKLQRSDCNLKPYDHAYYNSDLFPAILNRAYRQIIGEYSEYCYLDSLPEGVEVDTSKFLATVKIHLPASFK
jgi:hypothetical protein